MKKAAILLITLVTLIFSLPVYAADLDLSYAQSCILIDSQTGQVLYEYNTDAKHVYPASTTKIMTAILAIENGKMDQMMTASQAAVYEIGEGGMNIGIMAGETLSMEDLLNAMLLSSANETANILAENIAPTRKEFIEMMNAKAKELGANDTHFVNTCGIHDPDHYTTAGDLAKIARYAMGLPEFRKIVEKKSYTISPTNKHSQWPALPITNDLIRYESDYFSRVNGLKTGYTSEAGHNLVSSAIDDETGMEVISVVLGVKGDLYGTAASKKCQEYSTNLLEYAFKNYSIQQIADDNQVVKNIPVKDAKDNATLDVVTAGEVNNLLPNEMADWKLEKKEFVKPEVQAPVSKGDVLGYLEYTRKGVPLGKVDLIASESVEKSLWAKISDEFGNLMGNTLFIKIVSGAAIALILFIALRLTLRKISRTVNARKRRKDSSRKY